MIIIGSLSTFARKDVSFKKTYTKLNTLTRQTPRKSNRLMMLPFMLVMLVASFERMAFLQDMEVQSSSLLPS
jgi:hypothetical protein